MWILLACLTYSFNIGGMEACWSTKHNKTIHDVLYSPYNSDEANNTPSTEEEEKASPITSNNEYTIHISAELPEHFIPDNPIVNFINAFLSSYELNKLNTSSFKSFVDCFTNNPITLFIKKLKTNINADIAKLRDNPTTKNIPTMIKMQEHLNKITSVDEIPSQLEHVLMSWPNIPTQPYTSLLLSTWYTYILHLIPNTKLNIENEKVTTYYILDNYESPNSYIKQLSQRTNDFMYIFEYKINYAHYYITEHIIPSLVQHINSEKNSKQSQSILKSTNVDLKLNQHNGYKNPKSAIDPFTTVLFALNKLLSILDVPNCTIGELQSIDKLRVSWYKFWKNENLKENAENIKDAVNEMLYQNAQHNKMILNRLKKQIGKDFETWDNIWPHESEPSLTYHDGVIKSLDA